MFGFLEEPNNTLPSCFSHHQFYQPQPAPAVADPLGQVSSLNYSCNTVATTTTSSTKVSLTSSCSNNNSSSGDQVTQKITPPPSPMRHNKRKHSYDATSSAAQSMNSGEVLVVKGKKQRKINTSVEEKKKSRGGAGKKNNKAQSEEEEEATTEYIHVRARRGQATDSHSLAERVRREKISERMKLLQALVPGCDKVTGKALMLDEIINYVQSLQNQVEFLSMKLASVNPMFYDFGVDMEAFMVKPERMSSLEVAAQQADEQECGPNQSTTNTFTTTPPNNYPLLDPSTLLLLQQGQMPNILSQSNGQLLWDADEVQRQRITSQSSGFTTNMATFH